MGVRVGDKHLVDLTQVLICQRNANMRVKLIIDPTTNLRRRARERRKGWQFPMLADHFFERDIDQIGQIILAQRRFSHRLFHRCLRFRPIGANPQMSANDPQMAATCPRGIVLNEIGGGHRQSNLVGDVINHPHGNRRQRNRIA